MKFLAIHRLSSRLWQRMSGRLQWRLHWLINSKFVVGVSGIISDDAGRMLLVQPRYWPDKAWGLPGGMVKRGESFEEALTRELLEETGLR